MLDLDVWRLDQVRICRKGGFPQEVDQVTNTGGGMALRKVAGGPGGKTSLELDGQEF